MERLEAQQSGASSSGTSATKFDIFRPIRADDFARAFGLAEGVPSAGAVAALVAGLCVFRLVCAANLPLAGDELLYWAYSSHLAPGFVDHPFINPLLIRVGTTIFGQTEFGVRFMNVMLAIPATWAVSRAALRLFSSHAIALKAALLFNATLAVSVGSLAATSDMPVVCTSAFIILAISELVASQRGVWWLAIGAAIGLGMCAKYTTFFLGAGLAGWVCFSASGRRWLVTPWPWAGAAIALAIFSPVLLWNADHQWASFGYQARRMVVETMTVRYLGELVGSQILLLTPFVLWLAWRGVFAARAIDGGSAPSRGLLVWLIAPLGAYFVWHSLHQRVQGNWPEAAYPELTIIAAWAAEALTTGRGAKFASRYGFLAGTVLMAILFAQATLNVLPLGRYDLATRKLGFGMKPVAERVEELRKQEGAAAVLTTDYTLLGWLSFNLPGTAVI